MNNYETKEEAYKAGYENGQLVGTIKAVKLIVEKIGKTEEGNE